MPTFAEAKQVPIADRSIIIPSFDARARANLDDRSRSKLAKRLGRPVISELSPGKEQTALLVSLMQIYSRWESCNLRPPPLPLVSSLERKKLIKLIDAQIRLLLVDSEKKDKLLVVKSDRR